MWRESQEELTSCDSDKRCYQVFGLNVRSELSLPELLACPAAGPADVEIELRSLSCPPGPAGLTPLEGGALLTIPQVARYGIVKGRKILVDPAPGASERNVRLYLLGSAFGALLHQRGLLPLHANAVDVDGGAVAFLGHSGAGKSTLAAFFSDSGFRLLTDDVCVVATENGVPFAFPGIPRLRMWRDAIERSGRDSADYDRALDGWDKYTVPTGAAQSSGSLPLQRIYLLTRHGGGEEDIEVRPLQGIAAVDALVANTYRGAYVPLIGDPRRHLFDCVDLVSKVPLFELRRPWRVNGIDEVQRRILARLLGGD